MVKLWWSCASRDHEVNPPGVLGGELVKLERRGEADHALWYASGDLGKVMVLGCDGVWCAVDSPAKLDQLSRIGELLDLSPRESQLDESLSTKNPFQGKKAGRLLLGSHGKLLVWWGVQIVSTYL